jgi:hypothetical protein
MRPVNHLQAGIFRARRFKGFFFVTFFGLGSGLCRAVKPMGCINRQP